MPKKKANMVSVVVGSAFLAALIGAALAGFGVESWFSIAFWVWLVAFVLGSLGLRAQRRKEAPRPDEQHGS